MASHVFLMQGWKLMSVPQPLADDLKSGLTIFAKTSLKSAHLADDFCSC